MPEANSETGIRVVRAEREDLAAILRVQRLAFQSEAKRYNDPNLPPLTETLEEITHQFDTGVVLKAVDGQTIVGAIRGRLDGETVHVGRLAVHPEWQRRGIGKMLVASLEACFPGKRFELFTGAQSEGNLRLYENAGYTRFKELVGHDGIRVFFLEK